MTHLNFHLYTQTTIFDRVNERKSPISWRVHGGDFPLSLLFVNQWEPGNLSHYRTLNEFYGDAGGAQADFPAFTLIEPKYIGHNACDVKRRHGRPWAPLMWSRPRESHPWCGHS